MLAGVSIPSRRAADIDACLFILDQVPAAVQLAQNSGREALDIRRAGAVCKKAALEADSALVDIVRVAGLLADDKLTRVELRVCGDEALLTEDGEEILIDTGEETVTTEGGDTLLTEENDEIQLDQ